MTKLGTDTREIDIIADEKSEKPPGDNEEKTPREIPNTTEIISAARPSWIETGKVSLIISLADLF